MPAKKISLRESIQLLLIAQGPLSVLQIIGHLSHLKNSPESIRACVWQLVKLQRINKVHTKKQRTVKFICLRVEKPTTKIKQPATAKNANKHSAIDRFNFRTTARQPLQPRSHVAAHSNRQARVTSA